MLSNANVVARELGRVVGDIVIAIIVDKVLDSVKNSYLDARAKSLKGAQKYTIDGDDIIIFIKEDGTLDSAYGTYKFTKDYFGR